MRKLRILRVVSLALFVLGTLGLSNSSVYGQGANKAKGGKVCGDPTVKCKTTVPFEANDLPFQIPANANIWESAEFYAVILKSVSSPNDSCDVFVPEAERLAAQSLFPKMKVFSSRCTMAGAVYFSNVAPNQQFMAVFAGTTKAQANQMLATVKATGKYPGANIRKMQTGFNGT